MAKASWLAAVLLLGGCAAQVYHPTKSRAQSERDIKTCSDHGKLASPYEPISALNIAYECLEAKGYRRGKAAAGSSQAQ
jgi:hypothetical protein